MVGLNRLQLTLFFIFTFLLLSSVSFAADEVLVTVSNKDVTVYSGKSDSVDVAVQNNQNFKDRFSVGIFYLISPGISVVPEVYSIDVDRNSNSTFKIYFYASECVQELRTLVNLNVKSVVNEKVQDTEIINVNTIRNFMVCISDTELNKYVIAPGENLKISTTLKNPTPTYSAPLTLETKIMKGDQLVQRIEEKIETVPGNSMKEIDQEYIFDKYSTPGPYSAIVSLKDTSKDTILESKKLDFRVSQLPEKVVKEESITWGLFTQTLTIKVRNEGNTQSSSFYITTTIPSFMKPFFFPKVKPVSEEKVGNTIVYSWYIEGLAPAEEKQIQYEVSTWNTLLILLVIISVILYSFKYVFRISIIKRHRYTGAITKEKEIVISLEVRNRTRHEIKDIWIRDFVPSIATVVERFDTLRPTLRKVGGGTELVWKLESLGPLEERVLTYRVKPTVDIVGILKLPKALIRYADKEKKIKKVISKSIRIKGR